jgi:CheY-like chemotaxis protein/HPt (histidine-containing phosphotransfer) domain-containing protein
MGFEVDTAVNGREAVEKVSQGGVGFYDLILMDVQMPVMDGYEATRAIRAMDIPGLSDIPIAALSANAFESDVRDALAAGMNAHIAKPFVVSTLKARLSELLAGVPVRHRAPLAKFRAASTSAALMHRPLTPHDILDTLRGVGCDVDGALSRLFSGDEKFYAKMLAKLPENTAMARMRAALDAGDANALFEASHELKGVYANLGITPLYEPCREIVEIARAGSTEGVEELLGQMEELHAEVVTLARGGAS